MIVGIHISTLQINQNIHSLPIFGHWDLSRKMMSMIREISHRDSIFSATTKNVWRMGLLQN